MRDSETNKVIDVVLHYRLNRRDVSSLQWLLLALDLITILWIAAAEVYDLN